ncbi:MAG: EamA family transporter [Lachnospiraceae bacterium]|nr:EamA family transporter [Lachnospiraceae bacterium]
MERSNDRKSLGIFISSMLIFGTVGVLRRYIPLSSALLAFSRGILGGLFLLVFALIRKKEAWEKIPTGVFVRLLITGAMIGINWILLFEAYNHTTVAVATLCYYMEPTIVMLLSPLIFRERLTGKKALCAAVSIIGMVLVSGVIGDGGAQAGNLRGIALGLGAAFFYSGVVIMNKKTPGIDPFRRTTVLLLSAGLVMLPYLLLTDGFRGEGANAVSVLLLLVLGIVHTGIAYAMYFGSMDGLNVQTIAVFSYIDPVSALLFSALLLREPLSITGIIGAVLIIGSAIFSELKN